MYGQCRRHRRYSCSLCANGGDNAGDLSIGSDGDLAIGIGGGLTIEPDGDLGMQIGGMSIEFGDDNSSDDLF